MAENKLADLSMDFAVSILKVTDGIKGHYSIVNQLERSATSIGANKSEPIRILYLFSAKIAYVGTNTLV